MKKFSILSMVFVLSIISISLFPFKTEGHDNKLFRSANPVPNRYIVLLDSYALRSEGKSSVDAATELTNDHGGQIDKVFTKAINGFSIEMSEKAAERMSRDPRVKLIEQDSYISVQATQENAPWGLDRIDQRNVPLNSAYNYVKSGEGVHVYVIDTGIRTSHVEFQGRATADYDSMYDGKNGIDCHGHGTHVAGTIGGVNYGVAKDVRLHAIRVLGCNGLGTVATAVEGIDWVAANHISPAVANMSMGSVASPLMDFSVQGAIDEGVAFIVAAGNNNKDACTVSPARLPGAITVGATDESDTKAAFSNYGSCVDIFAPGVGITSAWAWNNVAVNTTNGTSMATPHVTGTAALFLETNRNATPAQVTAALMGGGSNVQVGDALEGSPNLMVFTAPDVPTAAPATVSGAVTNSRAQGLRGIRVTLQNASTSEVRTAITNPFGYYWFDELNVGDFYILSIENKKYIFENNYRAFTLGEDMTASTFIGTPR